MDSMIRQQPVSPKLFAAHLLSFGFTAKMHAAMLLGTQAQVS
jgi:hypothetical protein